MRLPIQVQGILFRKTDRGIEYLLLRAIPERGDFWQPVTGGVEEGETNVEALKREVWEETRVSNIIRIVEGVGYFEYPNANFVKGFDYIKEYVFGVEIDSNQKIILDGKEHSHFKWYSYQQAFELLKWEENKRALSRLNELLNPQR